MTLTDQQIAFFHTFGYLRFPGLMADSVEEITCEFETVWERNGGGKDGQPHEGTVRSFLVPFIDQSERLSALLDDPRLDGIFRGLLGDDYNYFTSDGNYYVNDTGWHSDRWHQDALWTKTALYLDPLTRHTGCLRVIPGSHRIGDAFADGLQESLHHSQESWGLHGGEVPAIALETQPGDIVVFNLCLKHASYGGGNRRRMFTINCSERYREDRLDELGRIIGEHGPFFPERMYGDVMVDTAGPQRMRHLEQALAHDDHLAELSRARQAANSEHSNG